MTSLKSSTIFMFYKLNTNSENTDKVNAQSNYVYVYVCVWVCVCVFTETRYENKKMNSRTK